MPRDKMIKVRRGTTAQWTAADAASATDATRLLADGEPGYDTTTGTYKIGNGTSKWADLPGFLDEPALNAAYAPSSAQAVAFNAALAAGRDVDMLVMGDSTGNANDEWPYLTLQALAAQHPEYTVVSRVANDAANKYDPATVLQTGPGGARTTGYVTLPGTVGTYLSTDPAYSVNATGDLDVRVKVNTDLSPVSAATFAAKFGSGGQRSWRLWQGATYLTFGWTADGTTEVANTRATVATESVVPAGPVWLRASLDVDNGAAGWTLRYHYSADEQQTWTQIGADVTGAGVTSVFQSTTPMELGSRSGGTAELAAGDYYALQVRGNGLLIVDLDFNQVSDGATSVMDRTENTWIFNGAPTWHLSVPGAPVLTLWNGSLSGRSIHYESDPARFEWMCPPGRPVALAFISHSHNESANTQFGRRFEEFADLILDRYPAAGLVGTLQNPRKAPANYRTEHEIRIQQVRQVCARRRWDTIDAHAALADVATTVQADGIHPTTAGSILWAAQVKRLLGLA